MRVEHISYLIGHVVRGSDANYRPRDSEFYRKLYEEKAMPFLRLEAPTPTESEKQIEELRQQLESKTEQLEKMEEKIAKLEPFIELLEKENPEKLKLFARV